MPITVRPAVPADALSIAKIHVLAWQKAYRGIVADTYLDTLSVERRASFWHGVLSSPEHRATPQVQVAIHRDAISGETVVGWIAYGKTRDTDKDETWAEFQAIYLHPSHWARGIGRQLSQAALGCLSEAGFTNVSLWVLAKNTRAREFYGRIGFAEDPGSAKLFTIADASVEELRYAAPLAPAKAA
jgi:GNAT superfamily N-acetyltransferase